jgi:hypothetical protein
MKMPTFRSNVFFQVILLIIFILGLMFYLNPPILPPIYVNKIKISESMTDMGPRCPNLLRQEGDMIMLYDLNQPGSDTNPAMFYNLAEYAQFVKEQQEQGIHCPVLELQSRIIGSSISDAPSANPDTTIGETKYMAYDTYGEGNMGKFTKEEEIIETEEISDNPMDHNWGGVQYSMQTLASGKYDGDMVGKPLYYNIRPNGTFFDATTESAPPNYVPPDLLGEQIQIQHNNR